MQNAILIFYSQGPPVKPGQAGPQDSINEFIIQKLNLLLVVGDNFRFIFAFLHA